MENCVFLAVFYVFQHVNLIFFKNNKSLEHLNILLRIFLFWVFFKILCWFLAFTKGVKSASPEAILSEKNIFFKILFSIIHKSLYTFSQQDSLHLKNKVVHCYPLTQFMKNFVTSWCLASPKKLLRLVHKWMC